MGWVSPLFYPQFSDSKSRQTIYRSLLGLSWVAGPRQVETPNDQHAGDRPKNWGTSVSKGQTCCPYQDESDLETCSLSYVLPGTAVSTGILILWDLSFNPCKDGDVYRKGIYLVQTLRSSGHRGIFHLHNTRTRCTKEKRTLVPS